MEDSTTKQYEIITLANGEQIIASVDEFVTVELVVRADESEKQEISRDLVELSDGQLKKIEELAKTNDIPSATIQANRVTTDENMQTEQTDNSETRIEP